MFGFSFLVFVSVFQLLPVAPYRMLALGGTPASAGWFLGLLTISCAVSAPFTGPLCDRVGHRRSLIIAGSLLSLITPVMRRCTTIASCSPSSWRTASCGRR